MNRRIFIQLISRATIKKSSFIDTLGISSRECSATPPSIASRLAVASVTTSAAANMSKEFDKQELKKRLTPLQYHVTQEKGTERPYTGGYNKFYEGGTYTCIVCEQELFSSDNKYDSGCGWPAFNEVLDQGRIKLTKDTSLDMVRTEVTCSNCGAHLGHVFNDGPKPKRKRFCINSASLNFHPADVKKE